MEKKERKKKARLKRAAELKASENNHKQKT